MFAHNIPDLSKRIAADIDKACEVAYKKGRNIRFPLSTVGDECWRKLYYNFRWVKLQSYDGRMYRLFQAGKEQEPKFTNWLIGAGFQVWTGEYEILHYHPESDSYFAEEEFHEGDGLVEDVSSFPAHIAEAARRGVVPKFHQFRVGFANGHAGGSLDSILKLPASYGIDIPMLGEYKTNSTGAGFNKLKEHCAKAEKYSHYGQMCIYGTDPKYNFSHALYLNINKNDSDIHVEVVALDKQLGDNLREKTIEIIYADSLPKRISNKSTMFICKACHYNDICHNDAPVDINCRSCKYSEPVESRKWFCHLPSNNAIIPDEFISKGCTAHVSVNKV